MARSACLGVLLACSVFLRASSEPAPVPSAFAGTLPSPVAHPTPDRIDGLGGAPLVFERSSHAGTARITLRYEDDGTSSSRNVALAARSRFNVEVQAMFPESVGRRFGAEIQSLGRSPAQLVVERAMYSDAGNDRWAAGTNALGTPLTP